MKLRNVSVVKSLISMRKVVQAGNVVVLHVRNTRDGRRANVVSTTMDMSVCLDEAGPVVS